MKTLPPGLQDHLDSGVTTLAWCWRVIRRDNTIFGFTDHDRNITFDSTTFEAASGFTGTEIRQSIGLSVDNMDASGALQSDQLSESDLAGGLFDDALIEIWRVNWTDAEQRVLIMKGSIGEVQRGENAFTAELRSLAHYLDQKQGRTYQYACDATLGDTRCQIDIHTPANKGTGVVLFAQNRYLLSAANLDSFAQGWFNGGLLTWLNGVNEGHKMEVKDFRHTDGITYIELWRSMSGEIAVNDNFEITVGCDKTFSTCKAKFSNSINFRGFPHIPGNKYMLAYPVSGDPDNDGTSLRS